MYFEFLPLPFDDNAPDNERSCVLRVIAGNEAILITGDLSQKGEHALIERYGEDLYSSVLILGHHGSKNSSGTSFLSRVNPKWAIASSGFGNAYRHPHPDVQQRLSANKITLWRTDTQGAIEFRVNGEQATIDRVIKTPYWWQKKPF